MPRITRKSLQGRVDVVNSLLGRPMTMFASKVGEPTRMSPGHITIDRNSFGMALEEILSEKGCADNVSGRLTPAQLDIFISGMLAMRKLMQDKNV
jgi:hypothetical protein